MVFSNRQLHECPGSTIWHCRVLWRLVFCCRFKWGCISASWDLLLHGCELFLRVHISEHFIPSHWDCFSRPWKVWLQELAGRCRTSAVVYASNRPALFLPNTLCFVICGDMKMWQLWTLIAPECRAMFCPLWRTALLQLEAQIHPSSFRVLLSVFGHHRKVT